MLRIRPTDRVLEIGSGNRPRNRSNVLCDKFPIDNDERASHEDIVIDQRPFVVADGKALPFKDKSFDYVITSHILEHVDDPNRFIAELTRVAKAGYIETPSELGEMIFGWPFHKWKVRFENDTIVLRPWTGNSPFNDFFHRAYASDLLFAEFVDSRWTQFYVQYEWEEKISIRVEGDGDPKVRLNVGMRSVQVRSARKEALISITHMLLHPLLLLLRHFRKFDR